MVYLICAVSITGSFFMIGAARNLSKASRSVTASAESLMQIGSSLGMSAQRVSAETALIDGLIRDLAHGHGLHYPDAAHDGG